MFLLRQAKQDDLESLHELALLLGPAGALPNDKDALQDYLDKSIKSFHSPHPQKEKNIYIFVVEDFIGKKIFGSSLIYAKKGTPESPNTLLQVLEKDKEDSSTQIKMKHKVLRFEFDTDGSSCLGGLILHPSLRKLPAGLGKQLSYSRFIFMGMQPEKFESHILAELLPPFNEDGSSELWEAFGKHFTGLPYDVADKLSRTNKDFITNLFPSEDIYVDLLSKKAQDVIGQTGKQAQGAKRLLEKIGFSYLNAVDPFDGGPYYSAKLKEISLIKRLRKVELSKEVCSNAGTRALLGFMGKNGFGCLSLFAKEDGPDHIAISADAHRILTEEEFSSALFYVRLP